MGICTGYMRYPKCTGQTLNCPDSVDVAVKYTGKNLHNSGKADYIRYIKTPGYT